MSNMKTCVCCGAEPFKLSDGGFALVHKEWCSWQRPGKSEEQGNEASDPVKAPAHYAGDGITTCEVAMQSMVHGADMDHHVSYWWQTSLKYLWRWPHKGNPLMDIDKAIESLEKLRKLVGE